MILRTIFTFTILCAAASIAQEEINDGEIEPNRASGIAPDLREDDTILKLQKHDFVVVPVPIVTPTIGSGLVVGGAYFYRQTEAQKKVQPASMTVAAGLYTNNDSKMIAIGHQSYWDEDTWRLGGGIGKADMKLLLQTPEDPTSDPTINWNVRGNMAAFKLHRKVFGNWYVGVSGR